MKQFQSKELLTFLSTLTVNSDGEVRWGQLDAEIPEISLYYTPHFYVSEVAIRFLKILRAESKVKPTDELGVSDALKRFMRSTVKYSHKYLYSLVQSIYLESVSILYALENDASLKRYITLEDARRIHSNVNYVIGELSKNTQNNDLIKELRLIDIDILYVISRMGGEYGALH